MDRKKAYVSILMLVFVFICNTSCSEDHPYAHAPGYRMNNRRLFDNLYQSYNPGVIPLPYSGAPLNVSITLFLVDILEVDIDRNQVEFLMYLHREYTDTNLVWNPAEYGDIQEIHVPRDIVYQTDVTFQGNIGSVSHQPERTPTVQVTHNGTISWTDMRRVRTLCQVYALSDRHAAECKVKVSSSSLDRSLVWLNAPTASTSNALLFSDATKYILISISARKDTIHAVNKSYEEMVFTITFGRITPP